MGTLEPDHGVIRGQIPTALQFFEEQCYVMVYSTLCFAHAVACPDDIAECKQETELYPMVTIV